MHIATFPAGPLGCNCSIVMDPESKRAIVVDPGGDLELVEIGEEQRCQQAHEGPAQHASTGQDQEIAGRLIVTGPAARKLTVAQ